MHEEAIKRRLTPGGSHLPKSIPMRYQGARQSAIQPARGVLGGAATGAALGLAVAGPAGALGGAIGGAILGPVVNWWYNLPTPVFHDRAEIRTVRRNLNPTPAPVPAYVPPVSRAGLVAAGQNLRVAPAPVPAYVPLVTRAGLIAGRQNLRPAPAPVPAWVPKATRTQLTAGRLNLRQVDAPAEAPAANALPEGWRLTIPDPQVVPIDEQTKGKTLGQMILLPPGVLAGRVLFQKDGGMVTADTVLGAGIHRVFYRYAAPGGAMGTVHQGILHIKPSVDELMVEMGFVSKGWRWELTWGTHGTLHKDFHLSVPKDQQYIRGRMDNKEAILNGLFPLGTGVTGTHMTIECRSAKGVSNAAYFLNGQPKYPQGYLQVEATEFVKACKRRLEDWKAGRLKSLNEALADL
jgi:hypothetical protein